MIKNWTVGRPGNEATLSNGYMISMSEYSVDAQLELFAGFKSCRGLQHEQVATS